MLTILSGLPSDRNKDKNVFSTFAQSHGIKIICGTSTIKTYCAILNLIPEISINYTDALAEADYKVEGISLACEGVITLNECYKKLCGKQIKNKNALLLEKILNEETEIKFIIGTAKSPDLNFYKLKKLLSRQEVLEKIINIIKHKKTITVLNF